MKYFLWLDCRQDGPHEPPVILSMIENRKICPTTLAHPEQAPGNWKPIEDYPEIVELTNPAETVSTPPPVLAKNPQLAPDSVINPPVLIEESGWAIAIKIMAALELVAAPLAGFLVGLDNFFAGLEIFICGSMGGVILLGFARLLQNSHESVQRLKRIEGWIRNNN